MEESIAKIIEKIFNNWTALQLAVEHSMGGSSSRQKAVTIAENMTTYIINNVNFEVEDMEDILEETMDKEFSTICEDNSIREISHILYKFVQLLKEGNLTQCEIEYNNLPDGKQWFAQSKAQPCDDSDDSEDEDEEEEANIIPSTKGSNAKWKEAPMEEVDPEWTTVKSKRNR